MSPKEPAAKNTVFESAAGRMPALRPTAGADEPGEATPAEPQAAQLAGQPSADRDVILRLVQTVMNL